MRQAPWDSDVKLPWKNIKEVWDGYWDQDKPLLVEKSPPNIIRSSDIAEHFSPVYFLIMVRNPYAHCEGLIRRKHWSAEKAAEFTVRCMRQQMENADKLDDTLCFTYEEMAGDPEVISRSIQSFIPQLGELNYTRSFKVNSIDGAVDRGIVDLNKRNISNLSVDDLNQINNTLKSNADIMVYLGYDTTNLRCIMYLLS